MAIGRLTVLKSLDIGLGSTQHKILYWYTINPVIQDFLGNTVAPQNRNGIPQGDTSPLLYLIASDLSSLDAGTSGYEVISQVQTASETLVAFRTRMTADHTARQTAWVAARRAEYAAAGNSVT